MCVGSAMAGSDYIMTSNSTLEFPIGSTDSDMRCLTVTISDDTEFEGDETFNVELTIDTAGVNEGTITTEVTITDNEGQCYIRSLQTH